MKNSGSDPLAEICIPGSLALQVVPSRMERHRKMLREFGSRLGKTGEADQVILAELNQPPLTTDECLLIAAQYESWCREKLGVAQDQS